MTNFNGAGTFVPIAFALAAVRAPVTLIEQASQRGWKYEVRYHYGRGIHSAELAVETAQLDAARDPGDFVGSVIMVLLHEVHFPDEALLVVQKLAHYVQDGGSFTAELVGGRLDGATYDDLPLDVDLFPPPELVVPLPRPWVGYDESANGDLGSATYRRDRLDPDRRVWLYRFGT